jgi:hypothetical protein
MKKHHSLLLGLCAAAAVALAADALHSPARSYKFRESVLDGVPKEWGRLVNASSFSDGTVLMFFEAPNGTIRRVGMKCFSTDAQWNPRVLAIPRP